MTSTYLCDALHYREQCMLCGHALELKSQFRNSLTTTNAASILVESGELWVNFKYDGYFSRFKMRKDDFQPMTFSRYCPICDRNMGKVKEYGDSTLFERLCNRYYYTFDVFADVQTGMYFTALNYEFVSFLFEDNGIKRLFCLESSFHQKESKLFHGDRLEGMLHKTLPLVSMKNINNQEAFINKIKLFSTFS